MRIMLARILAGLIGIVGMPRAFAQPVHIGVGLLAEAPRVAGASPVVGFVVPGSAADRAKVPLGVEIRAVDGRPAAGRELYEVRRSLAGDVGGRHRVLLGTNSVPMELEVAEVRGVCLEGNCRDGTGLLRDADGALYSGTFRDGKYNGTGRIEYPDGSWYEGGFLDGEFHGKGTHSSGALVFSGSWDHGREADGDAVRSFADGSRLEGTGSWTGSFTGKGAYIDGARGIRFEGTFRRSNRLEGLEGQVSARALAGGHVYRGEFQEGVPTGKGEIELGNGERKTVAFRSLESLMKALGGDAAVVAASVPPPVWSLIIEPDPVEAPVPRAASSAPRNAAKPAEVHAEPCPDCAGSGFIVHRCQGCQGEGKVVRGFPVYRKKETPYSARTVYDSAGRMIGQSSGVDVTYTPGTRQVVMTCDYCRGKGSRTTNDRCRTCGGTGKR